MVADELEGEAHQDRRLSLVDEDRIWFKSHHGLDVDQVDRRPGLCDSTILRSDPRILLDARTDMHALANPLVAGEFGLRFYVGVPLRTHDGFNLGTLCVIDRQPRPVSEPQIAQLKALASIVMDQMELRLSARRAIADLARLVDEKEAALRRTELMARRLRESEARLQAAVSLVKLGRYAWNPKTNELQWDETLRAMWSLPAEAPVDYDVWRAGVHPDDLALVEAAIQRCVDPQGDGVRIPSNRKI